jgi:hypothetical protein
MRDPTIRGPIIIGSVTFELMKLEISKSLRLKVTRDSGLRGYGTKESGIIKDLASESSSMDFERKTTSIKFLAGLPVFSRLLSFLFATPV